jgi:hypothetical protein
MRFQDAARDGRAVVYAAIQSDPLVERTAALLAAATTAQRIMARAVMNGESSDPATWREAFPTLFVAGHPAADAPALRASSEELLAVALAVADRGEQARSQFRGAIVESLAARLLARRVPGPALRRERRILFDGAPAEIHPYDVTVELPGAAEALDCKWGARGIGAEVLTQLAAARDHAADEGERLRVVLVVFDARRSCLARLARQSVATAGIGLVAIESLDRLAGATPAAPGGPG